MTDFDPIRALREQITGDMEALQSLKRRERSAEEAIARAEQELNDTRKWLGYVRIAIEEKREQLRKLEDI